MIDLICIQGKKIDTDRVKRLSEQFKAEIVNEFPADNSLNYFLIDKTGITYISGKHQLKGDFLKMLPRVTGGHLQHEILLKVANQNADKSVGALRAVDATAGMGEDSFILAAGGYRVDLFEHNPITAVLLSDSLMRARSDSRTSEIAKRMTMHQGDSKDLLTALDYRPDLIYLDPMFPEKKKSAESKAKLQMLHTIEKPCSDEEALMAAALAANPVKIIIKRPPGCEYLAGIKPTYSLERKAVRFDCINNVAKVTE